MDLLAEVLAVSGVRGTVAARIEAGAGWGWWSTEISAAAFHAVTSGTAWLRMTGKPPVRLMPGDVVLLPAGTDHSLASDPEPVARSGAGAGPIPADGDGVVRTGTGPVQTRILCALYRHDPAVSTHILESLPEVVHIRADNGGGPLEDTIHLLARELAHPQVATALVLDRLVDILLVQVLRVWLQTTPVQACGSWLGVLNDPLIHQALTKLHQDPARPWTTQTLADELAVSRATLSRRFLAVTGETPGSYLTRWRMDLAAIRLRDTTDTLESIARAVGYTSVYAFSRAFRRSRSLPPGQYRTLRDAMTPPP